MGDKYREVVILPYCEYQRLTGLAGRPIMPVRASSLSELMNRPVSSVQPKIEHSATRSTEDEPVYEDNDDDYEDKNESKENAFGSP